MDNTRLKKSMTNVFTSSFTLSFSKKLIRGRRKNQKEYLKVFPKVHSIVFESDNKVSPLEDCSGVLSISSQTVGEWADFITRKIFRKSNWHWNSYISG
jgi:hypothetical protein